MIEPEFTVGRIFIVHDRNNNDISDISFYFRSKQRVRIKNCIGLSKMIVKIKYVRLFQNIIVTSSVII